MDGVIVLQTISCPRSGHFPSQRRETFIKRHSLTSRKTRILSNNDMRNAKATTSGLWSWQLSLSISLPESRKVVAIYNRAETLCLSGKDSQVLRAPFSFKGEIVKDNWRMKNQLDVTYYFIVLLIGSTCFGQYYVHHQELATVMLITTLVVSFLVCCRLEVRRG